MGTFIASRGWQRGSLDRKLESWKVGSMKTTLDLPSDLVREMKLRAALQEMLVLRPAQRCDFDGNPGEGDGIV